MHNANNSGTTGRVRRTLGFSGFLVVQTFNCQVKKLKNGLMPVLMEQAEDKKNYSIDLTEAEWLYIISCLDENMQNAKKLWYQEMRGNDDSRRWKGTDFREA